MSQPLERVSLKVVGFWGLPAPACGDAFEAGDGSRYLILQVRSNAAGVVPTGLDCLRLPAGTAINGLVFAETRYRRVAPDHSQAETPVLRQETGVWMGFEAHGEVLTESVDARVLNFRFERACQTGDAAAVIDIMRELNRTMDLLAHWAEMLEPDFARHGYVLKTTWMPRMLRGYPLLEERYLAVRETAIRKTRRWLNEEDAHEAYQRESQDEEDWAA